MLAEKLRALLATSLIKSSLSCDMRLKEDCFLFAFLPLESGLVVVDELARWNAAVAAWVGVEAGVTGKAWFSEKV